MVLRITLTEPEKSSTDFTFQTISSQLKISTTPTTETFQVTSEKLNTKADQTTSHHTSTQNSVMANSEPMLVLTHEEMVLTLMFSIRTVSQKMLQKAQPSPLCKDKDTQYQISIKKMI